jgi:thiamine-monophosphate kinase
MRIEHRFLMTTEAKLIERILRRVPSRTALGRRVGLRTGAGDDAAVFRPPRGAEWVLTCDAFLENAHFLVPVHPPHAVGYKALARATSDLAAMGAAPRFFLLCLALPSPRATSWLGGFLAGMARAARRFGLVLAGGDTAQSATIAISITVVGEVAPGRAVLRSGARAGDLLYVSGRLGAAQLGLELVLRGMYRERRWQPMLQPHLYPPLRLELGQWLARRRLVSAMIDTSDGLSTDLQHLCQSSGVGARLWAERIPAVRVPPELRERGFDPLEMALHGGEDYELLFTVPRRFARQLPRTYRGASLTQIGEIVRGRAVVLTGPDGRTAPLEARGWDHFRANRNR